MEETNTFTKGLFIKMPNDKAPDFILLDMSVKPHEFFQWCQDHVDTKGWVNLQIKRSKDGSKIYGQLNSWKPTVKPSSELEGKDKINQVTAEKIFSTGLTDEELENMGAIPF